MSAHVLPRPMQLFIRYFLQITSTSLLLFVFYFVFFIKHTNQLQKSKEYRTIKACAFSRDKAYNEKQFGICTNKETRPLTKSAFVANKIYYVTISLVQHRGQIILQISIVQVVSNDQKLKPKDLFAS